MNGYNKIVLLIILFISFFNNLIFAQNKDIIKPKILISNSSDKEKNKNNLLFFKLKLKSKSPLLLLGKHYDPYAEAFDFIIPQEIYGKPNVKKLSFYEKERIRNEINQAMKIYRAGQSKYDLGVVGLILGYSLSASAIGLAIYHVHKYGFK